MNTIPTVKLPSGETVPALGQGTWHMGERGGDKKQEIAALQAGLDLGMTLLDTAEMYGEGGAEKVIREAVGDRRDEVFIVSKVYPHNATKKGVVKACDRSLKRLGTDRIDLYLLHWRGGTALADTLEGFLGLQEAGKIRHFGVSNFDREDMEEWTGLPGGEAVATNQVLYNLEQRGPEWALIPWCWKHHVPVMAYSPLEHPIRGNSGLLANPTLISVADRHNASPAQVALAWLLRQPEMIVIPKASKLEHVRENRAAVEIELDEKDLAELDWAFPPPDSKDGLAIR